MKINFAINENEVTEYSFDDFNEVSVHFEFKGVGVSLLGRPDVLSDTIEIVVSPYSFQHAPDPINSRLHCLTNQLIKFEIPTSSGGNLQLVKQEMFNLCTDHLTTFFNNDDSQFDYDGMVDFFLSEKPSYIISCAKNDPKHAQQILKRAVDLSLPFLTKEQLEFARTPIASSNPSANKNNKQKGKIASYEAVTGESVINDVNNPLTKNLTVIKVGQKDGAIRYSVCQPMPERYIAEDPTLSSDDLDPVVDVDFYFNGKKRVASISAGNFTKFAFIDLEYTQSLEEQERKTMRSIAEAVGGSIYSSYLKRAPHVRDAGDMFVSGFDIELESRFKSVRFTKKAKMSLSDQPVIHILTALHDLDYISLQQSKSDSKSQRVYQVSGSTATATVTTVELDAIKQNSWSGVSPIRWLSPNNSLGTASNSSAIIGRLIDYKIIDLAPFGGNKAEALSTLKYEINNYINDRTGNLSLTHGVNDGKGNILKVEPPLPTPVINVNLMSNFEDYLRGRGITQAVIDKAKKQKVIYTCKDAVHKESVAMVSAHNNGKDISYSVQKFIFNPDDRTWQKKMVTGASISGSSHYLKGSQQQYVVLGEANVDVYSFLSAIELSGGNPELYSVHSLMSAGYCDAWLEHSFGLKLPKEGQGDIGVIVNETKEPQPLSEASVILSRLFDQYENGVRYVCDGRPESQRIKSFFEKVVTLTGLNNDLVKIEESKTRETTPVYGNSGVLVFDRTCFEVTMNRFGLYMNQSGDLEFYSKHTEYVPIVTEEHKNIAKQRISSVYDNSKFILAFDNDHAGHPKCISLHKLFSEIGVGVIPFVVPFDAKQNNDFTSLNVINSVKSTEDIANLKVNEFMVMNDMNDYLKKMRSSSDNLQRYKSYLLNSVKGNIETSALLEDTMQVASAFKEQKHLMKQVLYVNLFQLLKKYNTALEDLSRGKVKKGFIYSVQKQISEAGKKVMADDSIPRHHKSFLKRSIFNKCVIPANVQQNKRYYNAGSDDAFNEAKKLSKSLVYLNSQYGKVKNSPEERKVWSNEYNELIAKLKSTYESLPERSQTNILKNKTVVSAMAIVKKSEERAPSAQNQNKRPSPRP